MRPKIGAGGKVENSELDNPETLAADPIKVELREVVWGEKNNLPLNITGRLKQFAK